MFTNNNQYSVAAAAAVAASTSTSSSSSTFNQHSSGAAPATMLSSRSLSLASISYNPEEWLPTKDRRSSVWNHLLAHRTNSDILKCRHCSVVFKAHRSTSTYRYHMQHIHNLPIENTNDSQPSIVDIGGNHNHNQLNNLNNNNKIKLKPKFTSKLSSSPSFPSHSQHYSQLYLNHSRPSQSYSSQLHPHSHHHNQIISNLGSGVHPNSNQQNSHHLVSSIQARLPSTTNTSGSTNTMAGTLHSNQIKVVSNHYHHPSITIHNNNNNVTSKNYKANAAEVLSNFFAIDLIPFRTLVRSREFQKCWKSRGLLMQMPTTERAMFDLVLDYAGQCQLELRHRFKQKLELDGERFTLALDQWISKDYSSIPKCGSSSSLRRSNNNRARFVSINLHSREKDTVYCLGAFRANPDDPNRTVQILQQRLLRFGIDLRKHIVAIVTDNSESMKQIAWHSGIHHQGCFNYGIHRAMSDILYRQSSATTIDTTNDIRCKIECDVSSISQNSNDNVDDDDELQFNLIEDECDNNNEEQQQQIFDGVEEFEESSDDIFNDDETSLVDDNSWLQQIRETTFDSDEDHHSKLRNCPLAHLPVVEKVRNIFRIFLRSKRRRDGLSKTYLVRMGKTLGRLRLDRERSWRLLLAMLKQFLEIQPLFRPILVDLSLDHLLPSVTELQCLAYLTQSLELVNVACSALAQSDCNLLKAGKIFEFLIRKLGQSSQQQQSESTVPDETSSNNIPIQDDTVGQRFCDIILKRVGERRNLLLEGLLRYLEDPYEYYDSVNTESNGTITDQPDHPSKDEITIVAKDIVSRMLLLEFPENSSSPIIGDDSNDTSDISNAPNSSIPDDSKYINNSIMELLDLCYQNNDSTSTFSGSQEQSLSTTNPVSVAAAAITTAATTTTTATLDHNGSSTTMMMKRPKYSMQTAADELQDFLSKKEKPSKPPKSTIIPSNDIDTLEYIKREMIVLDHSKNRTDCLEKLYHLLFSIQPTLVEAQKNSQTIRTFCQNLKIGIDVGGDDLGQDPLLDGYLYQGTTTSGYRQQQQSTAPTPPPPLPAHQSTIIDRFCALRSYLISNER